MTFETLRNDLVTAMKAIMPTLKGKADGKAISAIVAELCR